MYNVVEESLNKEVEMSICKILLEVNYSERKIQRGTKACFDKDYDNVPSMIKRVYQLVLDMIWSGRKDQ